MADVAGVAARAARHGALDDPEGWAGDDDGWLAGEGAGAHPHVHGAGVPDIDGAEAPPADVDRLADVRLCNACDSGGRGGKG